MTELYDPRIPKIGDLFFYSYPGRIPALYRVVLVRLWRESYSWIGAFDYSAVSESGDMVGPTFSTPSYRLWSYNIAGVPHLTSHSILRDMHRVDGLVLDVGA